MRTSKVTSIPSILSSTSQAVPFRADNGLSRLHTNVFAPTDSSHPIGIFDSGLGGLSVLADLERLLPDEAFIYFADCAKCPYGGRSKRWLRQRCLTIIDFLVQHGAKAIVVACNTASAAGLNYMRAHFTVPIIGLVPAVKPAVLSTRSGVVAVLATPGTIKGNLLNEVIERFATPANVEVLRVAVPGLVEAVESGHLATAETKLLMEEMLASIRQSRVDVVVLGCTHYPFLKPLIQQLLGPEVLIIDSGDGVARHVRRMLADSDLLRTEHFGSLMIYTSGDPARVGKVVNSLRGKEEHVLPALNAADRRRYDE